MRGGHGGVFRRVEAAAVVAGHVAEALHEGHGDAGFHGEVEGEHEAFEGEAHHAGGLDGAEGLEDGEEAGEAGVGDLLEDGDGAFLAVLEGDGVLELDEAFFAVEAVPLGGRLVEGIEEGLVVLEGFDDGLDLLVEEGGVEEADGGVVEGEAGGVEGEGEFGFGGGG